MQLRDYISVGDMVRATFAHIRTDDAMREYLVVELPTGPDECWVLEDPHSMVRWVVPKHSLTLFYTA